MNQWDCSQVIIVSIYLSLEKGQVFQTKSSFHIIKEPYLT